MVKNLEQYLSELDFNPPENAEPASSLAPAERVFVEKYLGLDALKDIPRIDPGEDQLAVPPVFPVIEVSTRSVEPEEAAEPEDRPGTDRDTAGLASATVAQAGAAEAEQEGFPPAGSGSDPGEVTLDLSTEPDSSHTVQPTPDVMQVNALVRSEETPGAVALLEPAAPVLIAVGVVSEEDSADIPPLEDAPTARAGLSAAVEDESSGATLEVEEPTPSSATAADDSAEQKAEITATADALIAEPVEAPRQVAEETAKEEIVQTEAADAGLASDTAAVATPNAHEPATARLQVLETAPAVETPAPVAASPHLLHSATPVEVAEGAPMVAAPVASQARQEIATRITMPSLRDLIHDDHDIQMVSFYVGKELFLLPVEGIQEVLRHMELVKVPRAPKYVAGVINLRGRITPLVHLSSLLTTSVEPSYDNSKFVIIYGSEDSRLGLIIDKISSMHMLPQSQIVWNVESRVGDAADCLSALANMEDKVTGIVAPDIIFNRLLAG